MRTSKIGNRILTVRFGVQLRAQEENGNKGCQQPYTGDSQPNRNPPTVRDRADRTMSDDGFRNRYCFRLKLRVPNFSAGFRMFFRRIRCSYFGDEPIAFAWYGLN